MKDLDKELSDIELMLEEYALERDSIVSKILNAAKEIDSNASELSKDDVDDILDNLIESI